ncbi:MAG: oxidoreductase [Gammaproteobacteria bacterium]|nr:oxidoreductase [Gammaproteobacteria bacterium]MCP5299705.1 oxidoreductase [Chromatiaceae bacterium]
MAAITRVLGPVTEATLVGTTRITPPDCDEVRRIRLRVDDPGFHFSAGQLIGVIVPGSKLTGRRFHTRRYSIASGASPGDGRVAEFDLLVRRCFAVVDGGGRRPGLVSHYLCDAAVGEPIAISGPFPSPFRVPDRDDANLIMIGTGTGVAAFRGLIQDIYARKTGWKGQVRLYYGAHTGMDLLYRNEETDDLANYYDRQSFKAFRALMSKPPESDRDLLEPAIRSNAQEIWELMQDGRTHVFLAGLHRIADAFEDLMHEAAMSASVWNETRAWMQQDGRWSEMVYS